MARDLEHSKTLARFARWSERIVASPYMPLATLVLIGLGLYALPPLGVPQERVSNMGFLISVATLLMIFMLEHNERRDTSAMHVKLDEILKALDADTDNIGVEELPAQQIEEIREREQEPTSGAGSARR